MARAERCPICNVAVKSENLLRHLNDTHPRNPDTPRLVENLKEEPARFVTKKATASFRVRRWHVALVALIFVVGASAVALAPYFQPCRGKPFPAMTHGSESYHWHVDLAIYSSDTPMPISSDVGITPGCMMPLHTHDASGTIHVEGIGTSRYTIGDFFLVWGKPFGNPTQMLVNGTPVVSPNPSVVLYDEEGIELRYAAFA
jgi:hypothetical protein